MTLFYIVVTVGCIWMLIRSLKSQSRSQSDSGSDTSYTYSSSGNSSTGSRYPYRPDVEYRLPNGRLTTKGYAARNPEQFVHWIHGPENVYGEYIDRNDWEEWRANYFGE